MVSNILWSVGVLAGLGLLLHCLARFCHVSRARRAICLFGDAPWLPTEGAGPVQGGEEVAFSSDDGASLQGTYFRTTSRQRRGVLVFVHELNGSRWSVAPFADTLRANGFDIFTFDQRNHGESETTGCYYPTPWVSRFDVADVQAAVDYLATRPDADVRGVGLFGVSKGGLVALCASAGEKRIRGVVIDSACMEKGISRQLARRVRSGAGWWDIRWAVGRIADSLALFSGVWRRWMLGWWCGCRFVNVGRLAANVRQPLLWIHGADSPYLRVDTPTSRLGRHRVWVVEDADHAEAVEVATEEYHARVTRFLTAHMASVPEPSAAFQSIQSPRAVPAFRKI